MHIKLSQNHIPKFQIGELNLKVILLRKKSGKQCLNLYFRLIHNTMSYSVKLSMHLFHIHIIKDIHFEKVISISLKLCITLIVLRKGSLNHILVTVLSLVRGQLESQIKGQLL